MALKASGVNQAIWLGWVLGWWMFAVCVLGPWLWGVQRGVVLE
jgi:hypothetical protein